VPQPIFGLTLDRMNRLYMGIVTGWGAVIGSAVSFMLGGAFIWAIVRLLRRDFPLSRVREARIVALIFAGSRSSSRFCPGSPPSSRAGLRASRGGSS
jgi:hypothetical protein